MDERPKVIGRCRTCKWFNDGAEPDIHNDVEQGAVCSAQQIIAGDINPENDEAAISENTWLTVGPLFGCVHWDIARRLEND